jgi:carboxypeptidase Taq
MPVLLEQITRGELAPLREWMRSNIHTHGRKFAPAELVKRITGTEMSAAPFLDYLNEKYTEIYDL